MWIKLKELAKTKSRREKDKQFYSFCKSEVKIIDVGVHRELDVEQTGIAANHFIKSFKFRPEFYTGLGIDPMDVVMKKYPGHNFVQYDGKIFPFKNKEFVWAYSNAVIEHVGDYQAKLLFVKEMMRVSENVFFTTPNKYFPVDSHTGSLFIHWHEKLFHAWRRKHKLWLPIDTLNLLSAREIKKLLNDAGVKRHRIIPNRFFGLTMTYTVIIFE